MIYQIVSLTRFETEYFEKKEAGWASFFYKYSQELAKRALGAARRGHDLAKEHIG